MDLNSYEGFFPSSILSSELLVNLDLGSDAGIVSNILLIIKLLKPKVYLLRITSLEALSSKTFPLLNSHIANLFLNGTSLRQKIFLNS